MKKQKLSRYVDTTMAEGSPSLRLRASAGGVTIWLGKSRRRMGWGQAWQLGNQLIHNAFASLQRGAPARAGR
jgi:hypothetical protein